MMMMNGDKYMVYPKNVGPYNFMVSNLTAMWIHDVYYAMSQEDYIEYVGKPYGTDV